MQMGQSNLLLWLVIAGAGMSGGFLYGIKDKKLMLPHYVSKKADHDE